MLTQRMKTAHFLVECARADVDKMRIYMRGITVSGDADKVSRLIDTAQQALDKAVAAFEAEDK